MTTSLTVEIGKMQKEIDERDAEIKRLKARNEKLEAIYAAGLRLYTAWKSEDESEVLLGFEDFKDVLDDAENM